MKNKKAFFTTKWIAYTAMFTALVIATGYIPPIPGPGGRIYWVDGIILIGSFLMDPVAAFIAGGIGSFLYDFIVGSNMMFFTLIIHGLQGVIVSALVHYVFTKILPKKLEPLGAGFAALVGAIEMILGYFFAKWQMEGLPVAISKVPRDIIQGVIGITIAMVICYATTFKRQLEKSHLLPDFKKEILDERKKTKKVAEQSQEPAVEATENENNTSVD